MSPNYYTIDPLEGERLAYNAGRDDLAQAFSRIVDMEIEQLEQQRELEEMQEKLDTMTDILCTCQAFIENYRNDYPAVTNHILQQINAIIGV